MDAAGSRAPGQLGESLQEVEFVGVGALTAARLLGEVGDIRRYPSADHFASGNGTAPIPVCSGRTDRHRLNRDGNRRLNRAVHTAARTQAQWDPRAKEYMTRSGLKARRALRRCVASSADSPT